MRIETISGIPEKAATLMIPGKGVRQINWFLTRECAHRCGGCRVWAREINPMDDPEREGVLDNLRRISKRGAFMSIMVNDLTRDFELARRTVEDAAERGFFVAMVVEGSGVSEEKIEILKAAGLSYLNISIDAMHGNNHRGERLLNLLAYARSRGIVPVVNSMIERETIKDQESRARFLEFADRVLKNSLFFNPIVCSPALAPQIGDLSNASPERVPLQRDLQPVLNWLINKKNETGRIASGRIGLDEVLELGITDAGEIRLWKCADNFRSLLRPGRGHLTLDSDGYVGPCSERPHVVNLVNYQGTLTLSGLNEQFLPVIDQCPGCLYLCLMTEEGTVGFFNALKEVRSGLEIAKVLSIR
ncbi:MAG: radical SAM protein [Patescibacteria group bacterium]|jgi:MoaA/NifB/PqqE/SkfB family radical SAM enzyme